LKSGKVGRAGRDVYEEESGYFFDDMSDRVMSDDTLARLLSFNNVIITSHQGVFTKEALNNIASTTMENISCFFEGRKLENEVCYHCNN
jgi:D-lactate dehydrogenase